MVACHRPPLIVFPAADLKRLMLQLVDEIAALDQLVAAQCAQIARFKRLKSPPSISPSAWSRRAWRTAGRWGASPAVGDKQIGGVAIEDRILKAEVPAGSRFKGYEIRASILAIARRYVRAR